MSEELTITSKEEFDSKVLKSELPSVVDFWAPWCMPCQQIAPVVEELATEFAGRVNIVKVNIDDLKEVSAEYDVMSIPNLVFIKDGKMVEQIIGSVAKDKLVDAINKKLL